MTKFEYIMNRLAPRYGVHVLFSDFLDLLICAFSGGKMEKEYLEIIKYGSKILTEPNPRLKAKKHKITRRVYIVALYNILKAMKGLRLVDAYGFKIANNNNNNKQITLTTQIDYNELSYQSGIMDCVNEETGEILSGYPNSGTNHLLNHRVNTTLEYIFSSKMYDNLALFSNMFFFYLSIFCK